MILSWIAAFFTTLLAGIKTTVMLAVIGAAVGVSSQLIGRLISGLSGYIAAAALGAVVLVGAYGSTSFDSYRLKQKDKEIAQLKFDQAKAERERDVAAAANDWQDEVIAKQEKRIEADKAQMDRLAELARAHEAQEAMKPTERSPDCPTCPKPRACVYPDELREIFRK